MPEHTDDQPDSPTETQASTATESTDSAGGDSSSADLPRDVAAEAARLTRLARDAADREDVAGPYQNTRDDSATSSDAEDPDEAELYRRRRDELLARFDYVARVRAEAEGGGTLVCYPAEWLDDSGTVRLDADLDTSRAVELSLAGPGEQGDFEVAAAENDELVEDVAEAHGELHAANVRSFADFMSNHYARPATTASAAEVREFLEHYYPRNAWPSEEQAAVVEASLRYAFELRDRTYPLD